MLNTNLVTLKLNGTQKVSLPSQTGAQNPTPVKNDNGINSNLLNDFLKNQAMINSAVVTKSGQTTAVEPKKKKKL